MKKRLTAMRLRKNKGGESSSNYKKQEIYSIVGKTFEILDQRMRPHTHRWLLRFSVGLWSCFFVLGNGEEFVHFPLQLVSEFERKNLDSMCFIVR